MKIDWSIVKQLPTDYTDYGGEVERWADGDDYPDCSCGCKWYLPVRGDQGYDWGVCTNPNAPRAGLLTWEHQTGRGCFEGLPVNKRFEDDEDWEVYSYYDGRASRSNMSSPGDKDYED